MAAENVLELDESNFTTDVTQSDVPVLVDFWAPWCGPCRMVSPVIDELATERAGSLRVGKVNVDENQALAVQYGIQSIPAFVLFKNGEIVDRMLGAMPKGAFQAFIDRNL